MFILNKSPRSSRKNASQERMRKSYFEKLNHSGLSLINKRKTRRLVEDDDDENIFERKNYERYDDCWSETYTGRYNNNYCKNPNTLQRKYKYVNQYSDVPIVQYSSNHPHMTMSQTQLTMPPTPLSISPSPVPMTPTQMGRTSSPMAMPPINYTTAPSLKQSKNYGTKSQTNLHPSNEFVPPFIRAAYKQNPNAIIDEIISPNNEGFGGLYLSDLETATDVALLDGVGVGAVLTLMIETEIEYPRHIVGKNLKIDDLDNYNILPFFNEAFKFIDFYRTRTNVLVHCFAGISRSPSIVMGYIMKHLNCDFQTAFGLVKEVRPEIDPNPGFIEQLKIFEEQILSMAQGSVPYYQGHRGHASIGFNQVNQYPQMPMNPPVVHSNNFFSQNAHAHAPVALNAPQHSVVPNTPLMTPVNYKTVGISPAPQNAYGQPHPPILNSPNTMNMPQNGLVQAQLAQGAVLQNNYVSHNRMSYPIARSHEEGQYQQQQAAGKPNPHQTQIAMQLVAGRGSIELRPSSTPQGNIQNNQGNNILVHQQAI